MGYDLTNGHGLNLGKGRRTLLRSFVSNLTITIELTGVWAMCQLQFHQPLSLKSHYTMITHLAHHRGSRTSVSATSSENFQVSTSHLKDGDEETIQFDKDPWIKHLTTLWDIRFEQREPPTEDKIT